MFANIDASMNKISTEINPLEICSNGIEKLNINIFYSLFNLMEGNHYILNCMGLYTFFGIIYVSSRATTEIELKKYFHFPDKEIFVKGMEEIYNELQLLNKNKMIINNNLIILADNIPFNPKFVEFIKKFCIFARVNIEKPVSESEKLNKIINKLCENIAIPMRNSFVSDNLANLQLMFQNTCIIRPIWAAPFDKITKGLFTGIYKDTQTKFLHSISKSYGYFEDGSYQVLEIKCIGDKITMGLLLPKTEVMPKIDHIKLHFYISNMRNSVMDEVKIPMFVKDCKIRLNNSLKISGLITVFIKLISPLFLPEGALIHDVVQNVKIIIGEDFVKSKEDNTRGYRTMRKFIADRPFIYYFRLTKTNTIIFIGKYD
jgi:serine protease inhibitor